MSHHDRTPALASGLVLVALFAVVAGVHGFVLLGASWSTGSFGYRINANFPTGTPGTDEQVIEAIRCGASAWRDQAQASLNPVYQGTTAIATANPNDGVNAAFFSAANGGGGTLAVTFTSSIGSNLVAIDMIFYGQNDFGPIVWNGVGDPGFSQTDLPAVATHEFGHAIGLDHPPIPGTTMFATYSDGDPGPRTLHPDDIDGARFLYGFNPAIDPDPQIDDVDPPEGPAGGGNAVTITGQNFSWESDTVVRIDGTILSPAFWDLDSCSTLRILSMPAHGPGPVPITIENQLGQVTLQDAYTYDGGPPTIQSIQPAAGPVSGGNTVSVIGQNLASDAVVLFGVQVATGVTQVSATELQAVVPAASGPGPVDVIVSQGSGSDSLTNGYLYSTNALRIESVNASIGASGVPSRALATNDVPLAGFSLAVEFDGTFVDIAEVTDVGTAAEGADFYQPLLSNTAGAGSYWTLGCVMAFDNSVTIPVGTETPIAIARYDIEAFAPDGGLITLDIVDGGGSPPTDLTFVPPGGISITPTAIDGLLFFILGGFIRGDSNQDGGVDVGDAIYTLAFLFSQGPGICPDAMDTNDDGTVDIGDAIYLLGFLFSNGPPPPAPHPGEGADPTADALGC